MIAHLELDKPCLCANRNPAMQGVQFLERPETVADLTGSSPMTSDQLQVFQLLWEKLKTRILRLHDPLAKRLVDSFETLLNDFETVGSLRVQSIGDHTSAIQSAFGGMHMANDRSAALQISALYVRLPKLT